MPSPGSFVVKNGSNARSRTSVGHPVPVVGDGDPDAALAPGHGDRERAALGHRVARVDREVHEDLLELARGR